MNSDPTQVPVLAKFYYDQYQSCQRVRLNHLVELVGVLDREEAAAERGVDDLDPGFVGDEP